MDDQPKPLRGPSLPGSLGVRVRDDWERFEEEIGGIDMRNSVGEDANVQLDLMKEVNVRDNWDTFGEEKRHVRIRGSGEDFTKVQLDPIERVEISHSRDRSLDETGRKFLLVSQTTNTGQFANINDFTGRRTAVSDGFPDTRERSLDETGRKFLLPLQKGQPQTRQGFTERQGPHNVTQSIQHIQSLSKQGETDSINNTHEEDSLLKNVEPNYSRGIHEDSFESSLYYRRGSAVGSDPVRPLPNGKKYHVFFSYEMADRDWVHSVVEKMESEHGYRCSFHERDFHGGKRVIENIDEHIQLSVKTVLVLSPDFLESSWCQFEMKQGLHASIEEARMLIVPVMVRECEVPDTLRSLTYIDATPGTDWWDRFLEAVAAEDNLQICNADKNQMTIQPKFENLDNLSEVSSSFGCCPGERIQLSYTPEVLRKPGIELPNEEFHSAISVMNSSQETNCLSRVFCDYIPSCTAMLMICAMLLFLLTAIASRGLQDPNKSVSVSRTCLLVAPPLMGCVVYTVLFFLQIQKRKGTMKKATIDMNRILLQFKILAASTYVAFSMFKPRLDAQSALSAKVTFYYYDKQQCEVHLREFLADVDCLYSQEYSKALIINLSEEYTRDYQEGKLKYQVGFVTRHVRHVKCLCQYIEDLLSQQENMQEFCEKKVKLAPREIV